MFGDQGWLLDYFIPDVFDGFKFFHLKERKSFLYTSGIMYEGVLIMKQEYL